VGGMSDIPWEEKEVPNLDFVEIKGADRVTEVGPFEFTDEDWLLYALLTDPVYMPELLWRDPQNHAYSGCYRVRDYQYQLNRCDENYAMFACSRSVGKTESEKAHAQIHGFDGNVEGQSLLITAPELIHLLPLADAIEDNIRDCRLLREMLDLSGGQTGFTHRPFGVNFLDGTKLIGRIPRITGTGVKGIHTPRLIIEEAQDYPEKGWIEVNEVCNYDSTGPDGKPNFRFWLYGVHGGNKASGFDERARSNVWRKTQVTTLMRPDWGKERKENAIAAYGGSSSPDYRRNILGEPGAGASQYFVTSRVMACFRPDTLVATKQGKRRIDSLKPGDEVRNAGGWGKITAIPQSTHRRIAVVRLNTGEEIICSPEHPFFAEPGWCHADHLRQGWRLYRQSETMRGLRGGAQDTPGPFLLEDLRRDMAGGNQTSQDRTHAARLRGLRRAVREIGCRTVLLANLYGEGLWRRKAVSTATVCDVRPDLSTQRINLQVLFTQMPGCQGGSRKRFTSWDEDIRPYAHRGDGGVAPATVRSLDGARRPDGRLVRAILLCAKGREVRAQEPHSGHRLSCADGGHRGRRIWPWDQSTASKRPDSRCLPDEVRVDGVEIYEPGSDGWTRHCGERDSITLYDLTVSGHPSFAVGAEGLLVHNCTDQRIERPPDAKGSNYNVNEYVKETFRFEEMESLGMSIADSLDLPAGENYKGIWGGVDIGLTESPTVISLFAEGEWEKKERLALVRKFTLERFRPKEIRQALFTIGWHFGAKLLGVGIDITGIGLPLYQDMGDDELAPQHLLDVTVGYTFNSTIPVEVDPKMCTESNGVIRDQYGAMVKREEDEITGEVRYIAMMPFIAASTRELRSYVDSTRLLLPFDTEVISDMLGETKQRVERIGSRAGQGTVKKGDRFHILDSFRAMAMRTRSDEITAKLAQPQQQPVLERA
jgi:preprotein translocase subunit YajC